MSLSSQARRRSESRGHGADVIGPSGVGRRHCIGIERRLIAEDTVHAFLYQPQWVTVANRNVRGLWKDMPILVNDLAGLSWA